MIKELERFLYCIVELKLKDDNKKYIGYFVKAQYFKNRYEILPIDLKIRRIAFYKSNIEKIKFYKEKKLIRKLEIKDEKI